MNLNTAAIVRIHAPTRIWGPVEAESAGASPRVRRGPQAAAHDGRDRRADRRKGYEATKIADIVRRAGVARKTLYDNFDGKEDLFLAALDSFLDGSPDAGRRGLRGDRGRWRSGSRPGSRPCSLRRRASGRRRGWHGRVDLGDTQLGPLRRRHARVRRTAASAHPPGIDLPETIEETLVGGVAWILQPADPPRRGRAGPRTAARTVAVRPIAVPRCRKCVDTGRRK